VHRILHNDNDNDDDNDVGTTQHIVLWNPVHYQTLLACHGMEWNGVLNKKTYHAYITLYMCMCFLDTSLAYIYINIYIYIYIYTVHASSPINIRSTLNSS